MPEPDLAGSQCHTQMALVAINIVISVPSSLLEQPSLLFRREERVHEVVIRLVRDLKRLLLDAPVNQLLKF
jgi:hypothetical protein